MKSEDGIATIAVGLGKIVMDGEKALRFSPAHPEMLSFSNVEDMLDGSQRFYSLQLGIPSCRLTPDDGLTLIRREIMDARDEEPVRLMSSTYIPDEHCIRDSESPYGYPVVTFAQVLKYGMFPLPAY